MQEVLVNRLGGLSLPRKSVVGLTDRPNMTLDVYCGRKTTIQQQQQQQVKYKILSLYRLRGSTTMVLEKFYFLMEQEKRSLQMDNLL